MKRENQTELKTVSMSPKHAKSIVKTKAESQTKV